MWIQETIRSIRRKWKEDLGYNFSPKEEHKGPVWSWWLQNASGKKMYMTRKNSEIWYYLEEVGISSCKKCSNAGNGGGVKKTIINSKKHTRLCKKDVSNLYIEKCYITHCWPFHSFWNQSTGQAKGRLRSGGRTRFMFSFLTTNVKMTHLIVVRRKWDEGKNKDIYMFTSQSKESRYTVNSGWN